jgi:hypothetical protein
MAGDLGFSSSWVWQITPWRQGVPGELILTKDFRVRAGFPKGACLLFFQSAWAVSGIVANF